MEGTELGGDQQFCLRWNNFQANITSQFEALRDDQDFVDVTLACEGHSLEAHKVVLSACSPYFKELFKNNPCPHPIIFMRDCEVSHVRALLQFMYVGQVNIAQAQLSAFLRTADALQIRGLTDCSQHNDKKPNRKSPPSQLRNLLSSKPCQSTSSSKATSQNVEPTSTEDQEQSTKSAGRRSARNSPDVARNNLNDEAPFQTSSQTRPNNDDYTEASNYPSIRVKTDLEAPDIKNEESETVGEAVECERERCQDYSASDLLEPKMEMMEAEASDDERGAPFPPHYYSENNALANPFAALTASGVDVMAAMNPDLRDENMEAGAAGGGPAGGGVPCGRCGRRYSNASNLRQHVRLIHEARPVACATCGRYFKTPLYLRRHMLAQHIHRVNQQPQPPPPPPQQHAAAVIKKEPRTLTDI